MSGKSSCHGMACSFVVELERKVLRITFGLFFENLRFFGGVRVIGTILIYLFIYLLPIYKTLKAQI